MKTRGQGPQLDFEPPRDWDPSEPPDSGPGDVWNPKRPRTPTPDYSMHFAEGGAYSALMRRLMGQRGNMGESDPIADTGIAIDEAASARYGKAWKRHALAGQIGTWLASAVTMPTLGFPLPPGTGVGTALATAEAHRMLKQVFGKHMASGGRADMTRGGVVPTMDGVTPGSDWHPAWLTDDEHVVNARSARKHRRLLEAINADHAARGGECRTGRNWTFRQGRRAAETSWRGCGKESR